MLFLIPAIRHIARPRNDHGVSKYVSRFENCLQYFTVRINNMPYARLHQLPKIPPPPPPPSQYKTPLH